MSTSRPSSVAARANTRRTMPVPDLSTSQRKRSVTTDLLIAEHLLEVRWHGGDQVFTDVLVDRLEHAPEVSLLRDALTLDRLFHFLLDGLHELHDLSHRLDGFEHLSECCTTLLLVEF